MEESLQGGIAPFWERTAWDTSGILWDTSLFGRLLHTMLGYDDQPSQLQVAVYLAVLLAIFGLMKFFELPKKARPCAADRVV